MYPRVGDKRRIEDIAVEDEEAIGSLCRLGNRPVSPKSQMEQEKRIRREIANSNERRRMQSINAGFNSLKTLLPHHEGEKLSKAAILQQTAEYIYQMEQEKTRLLSQNCQLKRIINQQQHGVDSEGSPQAEGEDGGGCVSNSSNSSNSSSNGGAGVVVAAATAATGVVAVGGGGGGGGPTGGKSESIIIDELRREMIDLRMHLDRERKHRMSLEDHTRNLEAQTYPERVKEITQQVKFDFTKNGDVKFEYANAENGSPIAMETSTSLSPIDANAAPTTTTISPTLHHQQPLQQQRSTVTVVKAEMMPALAAAAAAAANGKVEVAAPHSLIGGGGGGQHAAAGGSSPRAAAAAPTTTTIVTVVPSHKATVGSSNVERIPSVLEALTADPPRLGARVEVESSTPRVPSPHATFIPPHIPPPLPPAPPGAIVSTEALTQIQQPQQQQQQQQQQIPASQVLRNHCVYIVNPGGNATNCQKSLDTICEAIRHLEGDHMFTEDGARIKEESSEHQATTVIEEEIITDETLTIEDESGFAFDVAHHTRPQEVPLELTTHPKSVSNEMDCSSSSSSCPTMMSGNSRPGVIVVKHP